MRSSIDQGRCDSGCADVRRARGTTDRPALAARICAGVLVLVLSACSSAPRQSAPPVAQPAGPATTGGPADAGKPAVAAAPGSAQSAPVTRPSAPVTPPSARATADFNKALGVMRGGNATEAELEFKQMALAYPQLAAPYVNLGILYRKAGHLDQSEEALKNAVQRNGSALAWTELGATQRLRGKFPDAAASYEHAIAVDPNFAPAYRNLAVVSDLYLGDPERALTALERYKELSGEDRPVTSWIAELRQRTGKPAGKSPATPAAPPAGPSQFAPTEVVPTPGPAPHAAISAAAPPRAGD